ncbi:cuticle protein CP14.6-like [Eriocheir sinensis]|uniref:cuticle protein CP14.6-like n=1 Tax=Eriocheir sinensis TaxID=95602 RepID=UPI0021CA5A3A|nr:cuticle protein CP14.6-like [Eriocheir sinensis]
MLAGTSTPPHFRQTDTKMNLFVLAFLAAVAAAAPQGYEDTSVEYPAILVDERQMADDASSYTFKIETQDGITRQESGSVLPGTGSEEGGIEQSGTVSFTLPDGQLFQLSYVADENGFQPESSFLPVAPEFPHEIPQFVLDQIAKAREEEKESPRQPSSNYASP